MSDEPRTIWARGLTNNDRGRVIEVLASYEEEPVSMVKNVEYFENHTIVQVLTTITLRNNQLVIVHD